MHRCKNGSPRSWVTPWSSEPRSSLRFHFFPLPLHFSPPRWWKRCWRCRLHLSLCPNLQRRGRAAGMARLHRRGLHRQRRRAAMLEWASVCTRVCVRANGRFDFQALQKVLSEKQTNNNNEAKAEKHRCKKNNNKKRREGKGQENSRGEASGEREPLFFWCPKLMGCLLRGAIFTGVQNG